MSRSWNSAAEFLKCFRLRATRSLGERIMDKALVDYIVKEFKGDSGIDVSKDKMAMQRIQEARRSQDRIEQRALKRTLISFYHCDSRRSEASYSQIYAGKTRRIDQALIERMRHPIDRR